MDNFFLSRLLLIITVLVCLTVAFPVFAASKKIIYSGWSVRDTQYVRQYSQQMETMPFDGTVIGIQIDRTKPLSTANGLGWLTVGGNAFTINNFQASIDDLKATTWTKFTDNFLLGGEFGGPAANGSNFFDDAHWTTITNNIKVAAQISAQSGLKGLVFDVESYGGFPIFSYLKTQKAGHDAIFADYQAKARQRGREVMVGIASALPDPIVLFYLGDSWVNAQITSNKISLDQSDYSLLPAFIDGFLEAMPPTGQFVDSAEQTFACNDRNCYQNARNQIKGDTGGITLSTQPALYRKYIKAGLSLWPDYYGNANFRTPAQLQDALTDMLQVSDGYAWIYSQAKADFFPLSGVYPPSLPSYYLTSFNAARTAGNSPIAYWPFDETSGTTANDASGKGNTGTLVNGPTWSVGTIGGTLTFDGVDDYVKIPDAPILDLTTQFSLSAWAKISSAGSRQTIISKDGVNDTTGAYNLSVGANREVTYETNNMGGLTSPANIVPLNQWAHIAVTFDDTKSPKMQIFVNGSAVASGNPPSPSVLATNLLIARRGVADSFFKGSLDDVRMYNFALVNADIQSLYAQGNPPATLSNITLTPSLEGRTTISSGTAFTLTFFTPNSTTQVASVSVSANTSGNLTLPSTISLAPGSYDVLIRTNGYLKKKQRNVSLSSNSSIRLNPLTAGDLNTDNSINSLDWSLMNSQWFSSNSQSDVNGDGIVNSLDFSYLNANWNKVGD